MQIIQDYRTLHRIPELDSTLPKTLCYIKSILSPLGCRIFAPVKGALCAFFDFGKPDALCFRADMDALPPQEQTGLPFCSVHPGAMHACGHDGHTAVLLETARRIQKIKNPSHNFLLIFQPAEETTGGAEKICCSGILEQYRVLAIFALHLWPGLRKGEIFSRPGVLMSHSTVVTAEFTGTAAHIADFRQGADALCACCRFYHMAQQLPCFLKFGKLTGGSAGNILCDRAVLEGSLRTFCQSTVFPKKLENLCRQACRGTGCQYRLDFSHGYPAVFNDPALYRRVARICPVGNLPAPLRTAEDFSYYQKIVPGVYFLLGIGVAPPLHSPRFSFDEALLSVGADLFERLFKI